MSRWDNVDEIWMRAEREELRKVIAVLPDPQRVAESLCHASLIALIHALRDRNGSYRLPANQRNSPAWRELVAAGIVESGWGGVGTFGEKVRREALKMKLYGELG
jgi:hypothetical protein